MKRMSEVFELPINGARLERKILEAHFCTEEDHAAHAINHIDSLADALEALISDNTTMGRWLSDNYWDAEESESCKKAKKALAAYRGGK